MNNSVPSLKIFSSGLILGAAIWAIHPFLFGKPMPIEYRPGTYIGVAVMSVFSGYIGYRFGLGKALLSVLGQYVGQIGYCYLFVLHDGWIIVAAISTLFWSAATAIAASIGAAIGFARRSRHREEQQ